MALTKITGQVINNTTDLVVGVTTVGGGLSATDGFFSGIVTAVGDASFSGNVSVGGTLTYEDVTNVNSVGNITVGSGITLSKDGDIFFTGIMTGNGSGLTGVANTDVIFPDKISFSDSIVGSINLGIGSDLQIYHSGNGSFIKDVGTGQLHILTNSLLVRNAANNEEMIVASENGSVELYHNDVKKLETASGGVTVTGTVAATSYTGDGSALTGIQAGVQTSVPKSVSGITTVLDLSKDDFKITAAGITTIDVRGGSEGNSHTLRIHNSGITTVGFSTYFLFPSGAAPIIPTADGTISLISFTVDRQGAVGLATQLLAGSSVNFS
mgnify:CR=1 FL=1